MKKYLPVIVAVLLFAGCKKVEKDVYNYFPKVRTVNAVVQPDGSILVTGELLATGAGELEGIGFCMDTLPNPEMHFNQKICDTLFDNSFHTSYADLDATKKYYFRAWAVNEYGYTYGEDILIDNITIDSSLIPCHPDPFTMTVTNAGTKSIYSVSNMDVSSNGWSCNAYSENGTLAVTFFRQPITGIYKITENPFGSTTGKYINILYSGSSTSGTYAQSGNVLVNQVNPSLWEITICDALLPIFSGDRKLTARFRVSM